MYDNSRKKSYTEVGVVISEKNGVRLLHLGGSMIQSAMRINAPNELELLYTRCMMGFLLFHPTPSHILMIGLGGGSLAKFVYHKILQTKTIVVEINQQVVNVARDYFALPSEDDRFQIIIADGAEYITNYLTSVDVLMVDGFDEDCQVASLCSQEFYDQAHRVLRNDGVLVLNLLSCDKNLNNYLQRVWDSFQGHVITMLSEVRGNLIVFAFKQNHGKLTCKKLKDRANKLAESYGLPFPDFVFKLRKYSGKHSDYVEI